MGLKELLRPESVAIIGASGKKEKLGWQILNNIQKEGFSGKIYPVNPERSRINGLKTFQSVVDIEDETVDLAVIVIPARLVLSSVKSCIQKGITNIIIISAGFSEAGSSGKKRERELQDLAAEHKLNILGPNCLGIINSEIDLNATFADFSSKESGGTGLAFLSQSGAVGSAFLDWSRKEGLGVDYFVSLGNKAVLEESDFFSYFSSEGQITAVAAYLEEISQGKKFMAEVSKLAQVKPVVILKSGRTKAGQVATMSHTGSLAGSEKAVETGLARSGAIIVDNLEELFYMIKFLQVRQSKKIEKSGTNDKNIYLLSNAGGPMVVAVDDLARSGLNLPTFPKELKTDLEKNLPELTSYQNPLDVLGDAPAIRYEKALQALLEKGESSYILLLLTPQSSTEIDLTVEKIKKAADQDPNKMIISSFLGGSYVQKAKESFKQVGLLEFDYPNQAITCLSKYLDYQERIKSWRVYNFSGPEKRVSGAVKHHDFLESLKLLAKYDIPTLETKLIKGLEDLRDLEFPIVLKMAGEQIVHKTEKKALALGLDNFDQAKESFEKLQKNFPNAYCLAQKLSSGQEMILGFKRDSSFGPIIMVGWGGVYTELLKDIQTEADDVCPRRARQAIKKLKLYPVLKGFRQGQKYDLDSLVKAMVNLGRLARENPLIQELDINPLFVRAKGCSAVDVRIISRE